MLNKKTIYIYKIIGQNKQTKKLKTINNSFRNKNRRIFF